MLSSPYVFGYHGCDAAMAKRLAVGEADLFESDSEFEWLGHGIYFWEDSPDRALRWANEKLREGTIKHPAVIGAIIDLGNCLNLVDTHFIALVKEAYEMYRDTMSETGQKMPVNSGVGNKARALDCAVIESLHQYRPDTPFQTVRSFFLEGKPLYDDAGFRELDHVQICVRSRKQIKGYFLPR